MQAGGRKDSWVIPKLELDIHDILGVRMQDPRCPLPFDHIQIWYKLHVQQYFYHEDKQVDVPQTLRAFPASPDRPHGLYNAVITSPGSNSDWPRQGIEGTGFELVSWNALLRHGGRLHCRAAQTHIPPNEHGLYRRLRPTLQHHVSTRKSEQCSSGDRDAFA